MYTGKPMPAEFEKAELRSRELLQQITARISPTRSRLTCRACDSWYADPNRRGFLYVLRDGHLTYKRGEITLFWFGEGELVGIENIFCPTDAVLSTEFAVVVDEYAAPDFFNSVHNDPALAGMWDEYLSHQFALYSLLLTHISADSQGAIPDLRCVMAGDTIIAEGELSQEVFNLVDGIAEVQVDGRPVAQFGADQIFGAVGALVGTPRAAEVRALTDCLVVVLTKEQFEHVIQSRPSVAVRLLEHMAKSLYNSSNADEMIAKLGT